ncbi:TetR/AcrR family transcriptional regulator [Agrobacterium sp. ES01]|uniref:TetR/AcrR family transcriptional regulator n=1 Tax=Agrobacterium sp. ES01 TaxID=3420714 RepID=UPI003D09FD2B
MRSISRVIVVINKSTSIPRPRGRPRAFDRAEALEHAGLTFWRLGYEGASIADLTKAMGITPQSLYSAFSSKADLYREALDWYQSRIGAFAIAALEEPEVTTAIERLLMEAAVEFSNPDRPHGCMISTAVLNCAEENQTVAAMVAGERKTTLDALQNRIARGIAEGQLPSNTDPQALARFVGAIIQGMSVQAKDGASAAELKAIASITLSKVHGLATAS